ncbi:MAG: EpsI family protein [Acidobacteria bacterium]|nr:EpsI family protein [Acidobacteriota bacterium]
MNSASQQRDWRLIVTVMLLAATFFGMKGLSQDEPAVARKELKLFPRNVDSWETIQEVQMEERTAEVLAASDTLNRVYQDGKSQAGLGLFIAFFNSQRRGGAVHSPKNCLPGSGWSAIEAGTTTLKLAGYSGPATVNRYLIQKDRSRQLVLYWYQSQGRVIASEYSAKFYLMWDAATRRRSDGALIRIVTPIIQGDEAGALQRAQSFAQQIFPLLPGHLPN